MRRLVIARSPWALRAPGPRLAARAAPASPFFVDANWLWFTAFVGANLFQSGITRRCPLEKILLRLGVAAA
jgi:hypothetical protein